LRCQVKRGGILFRKFHFGTKHKEHSTHSSYTHHAAAHPHSPHRTAPAHRAEEHKEKLHGEVQVTGLPPIAAHHEKKEEKKADVSSDLIKTDIKHTDIKILGTYDFISDNIPITIQVYRQKGEFVPLYNVSISLISRHTEIILEKIRQELTQQVSLGMVDILATKDTRSSLKQYLLS
jgi:hypothetical protein